MVDYPPRKESGGPAGLLRLPGRALGAHPDDEPDRVDFCDDSPPNGPGQGVREPEYDVGDDLQAGDECRETLAQNPWIQRPGQDHRRSEVQRRSQSEQQCRRKQERRLITPYTRIDYSSLPKSGWEERCGLNAFIASATRNFYRKSSCFALYKQSPASGHISQRGFLPRQTSAARSSTAQFTSFALLQHTTSLANCCRYLS